MKITGRDLVEQLGWKIENQSEPLNTVLTVVNPYEEYEIKEPMYSIKLPKLRTTDNEPQYLSRRKSGGSWFTSRANADIKQAFTKAELLQVPEEYRQYAKRVEK